MFNIFTLTKNNSIENKRPEFNSGFNMKMVVCSSSYSDIGFVKFEEPLESRLLLDFNMESVSTFIGVGNDWDATLQFVSSKFEVKDPYSNLVLYPLSSSFVEGYGYNFSRTDDSSWNNRASSTPWNNAGGDYLTNFSSSVELNPTERLFRINVSDIITNTSQSFNGLIGIIDGDVPRLELYTRHTTTGLHPKLIVFKDDYQEVSGSAQLFRSGSITDSNFVIRPMVYQSTIGENDDFVCYLNVEELYQPTQFIYSSTMHYLPQMQYRIFDVVNGLEVVPYSTLNKVSVFSGARIQFSTRGLSKGSYSVQAKYSNGIITKTSDHIPFRII
jgi:hypothetical protein